MTKVCINPECGKAWEPRHFRPTTGEVDGRSAICDGCRYRMDTYRRLITARGFSETQAAEECRRRFDASGRSCSHCSTLLPAAFFQQGRNKCISCTREYDRLRRENIVAPMPPAQKQCTRCHKLLSAVCFVKDMTNPSGLKSHCRECHKKARSETRQSMRQVPLPAAMQPSERRCTACQQIKAHGAFYVQIGNPRGATYECKACRKFRNRMAYQTRRTGVDSPAERTA
mmetsp:Transcript_8437/g.25318  ORF Transcript_8437/g.25318 Transcript_8437/m.25318 type:complete len:228 (-) Transcript_8437:225-908(-)